MLNMTNVKFYKDKNGDIIKYIVDGHTGFDEHGKDIVCAAISVLAQTGVISLKNVCDIEVGCTIEDGFIEVVLPNNLNKEKKSKAQVVLQTILVGIKSTMESYPEHITLEYGEV